MRKGKNNDKNNNKKRNRWEKLKFAFGVTFLIGAVFIYAAIVYAYFHYTSKEFTIRYIITQGNRVLTLKNIEKAIPARKNLKEVNVKQIYSNLMLNPWIKSASVAFFHPDTLYIKVIEKKPVAIVKYDHGKAFIIDNEGKIITSYRKSLHINKNLPQIILKEKGLLKENFLLKSLLKTYQKLDKFGKINYIEAISEGFQLVHLANGLTVAVDSLHCSDVAYRHLREKWAVIMKNRNKMAWVNICFKDKFVVKWKKKESESGGVRK